MENSLVETIQLTDDRFLGVAWKDDRVHSMCIATSESVAQKVTEQSLRQKPIADQVFENIGKMARLLL